MKEQLIKIKELLKNSGFLDKEIAIYLTILELGRGTVAEISRKAGINRSTGYVILDSLAGKNLVSISGKEPKQEYVALSPSNLVEYLNREASKQKKLTESAREILPELTSIYNVGDRPKVFFYEGLAGLEHVYEDSLTSSGDIYSTSTYEEMHETLPKYFSTYYERRAKEKSTILVLPHGDLGVDFFDEVEDDGDNNEDGRTAYCQRCYSCSVLHNKRQDSDEAEENCA